MARGGDSIIGAAFAFVIAGVIFAAMMQALIQAIQSMNSPVYMWLIIIVVLIASTVSDISALIAGGFIFALAVAIVSALLGDWATVAVAAIALLVWVAANSW